MLSKTKQTKLLEALKTYNKKFLSDKLTELDKSGSIDDKFLFDFSA